MDAVSSHQPLLTIAVPTFNRASYLETSDRRARCRSSRSFRRSSSSSPTTPPTTTPPRVIAEAAVHCKAIGLRASARIAHATNIGSDANFASIYAAARGTFFWGCGDDDLITPGALAMVIPHLDADRVDLLYATSYGFHDDYVAERSRRPLRPPLPRPSATRAPSLVHRQHSLHLHQRHDRQSRPPRSHPA